MKNKKEKTKNLLYIGGAALVLAAVVTIGFVAGIGAQLQGNLSNLNINNQKINTQNLNIKPGTRIAQLGNVTCKTEVKDSTSPGFKTISWTAEVKNATPLPYEPKYPGTPNSSDEANIYKLVWFMDDCGKKSGPQGWEGTAIQTDCPKTQKTAKITVVAAFKEANGINNVANCSVNL